MSNVLDVDEVAETQNDTFGQQKGAGRSCISCEMIHCFSLLKAVTGIFAGGTTPRELLSDLPRWILIAADFCIGIVGYTRVCLAASLKCCHQVGKIMRNFHRLRRVRRRSNVCNLDSDGWTIFTEAGEFLFTSRNADMHTALRKSLEYERTFPRKDLGTFFYLFTSVY